MKIAPENRPKLGIILLTLFINMVGIGIIIPVLPLYAQLYGASDFQIGLLLATFSACQFVFSPFIGKLSDRVGRRPILIVSVFGTAVGFFLMGAAHTLALLFAARVIDGISGANIGTAQAYIADITSREERGSAMGLMGAVLGLGFIFGPFIGGMLSEVDPSLPFYAVGVLSLVNLALILARLPESLTPEMRESRGAPVPLRRLLRHTNASIFARIVSANFFSITGFAIMTSVWALFLSHRFDYGARVSGNILAYVGIIGVLVQGGLLRRLLRRGNMESKVAVCGGVVLAASLAYLPFVTGLPTLLLASTGLAVGNSLLTPTINALASLSADAKWQGRALGVLQSAASLGRTVGPLLAGWFLTFDKDKTESLYAHSALLLSASVAAVALLVLLTVRQPREIPEGEEEEV